MVVSPRTWQYRPYARNYLSPPLTSDDIPRRQMMRRRRTIPIHLTIPATIRLCRFCEIRPRTASLTIFQWSSIFHTEGLYVFGYLWWLLLCIFPILFKRPEWSSWACYNIVYFFSIMIHDDPFLKMTKPLFERKSLTYACPLYHSLQTFVIQLCLVGCSFGQHWNRQLFCTRRTVRVYLAG